MVVLTIIMANMYNLDVWSKSKK